VTVKLNTPNNRPVAPQRPVIVEPVMPTVKLREDDCDPDDADCKDEMETANKPSTFVY